MPIVVRIMWLNLILVALLLSIGWTLGPLIINAVFNLLSSIR